RLRRHQRLPERARSMALQGAEILLHPPASRSAPHDNTITSRHPRHRAQQGHAGANLIPLIASNRILNYEKYGYDITFY
ncbi:N-carbamoylputrescine amidase, partial [Pseudomonas syringae pv. tagetis]